MVAIEPVDVKTEPGLVQITEIIPEHIPASDLAAASTARKPSSSRLARDKQFTGGIASKARKRGGGLIPAATEIKQEKEDEAPRRKPGAGNSRSKSVQIMETVEIIDSDDES